VLYKKLAEVAQEKLSASGEELSADYSQALREMSEGRFCPTSQLPMWTLWSLSKSFPKATTVCPVTSWQREPLTWHGVDKLVEFADSQRPLVVDIGSGLGSFILSGAQADGRMLPESVSRAGHEMSPPSGCNWLGVDLQPAPMRRAQALVARRSLQHQVQFLCGEAGEALEWILQRYPGPVRLVAVQFPTPFCQDEVGESEDAVSLKRKGTLYGKTEFMVQTELVSQIVDALQPGGAILLKSQIEPVLESMKEQFFKHHLFEAPVHPASSLESYCVEGKFSALYSMPYKPETEVACDISGRPVYTCVLGMGDAQTLITNS